MRGASCPPPSSTSAMEPPPDDLDFLSAQAEAEAEEDEQPPDDFDLPAPAKQQHQTTLPFAQQLPAQYLPALNEAQRSAVTYAPAGGLQILAGPGSGASVCEVEIGGSSLLFAFCRQDQGPYGAGGVPDPALQAQSGGDGVRASCAGGSGELTMLFLRVVTFTNKAANEMKARLKLLVGSAVVERLMMGTFHSCAISLFVGIELIRRLPPQCLRPLCAASSLPSLEPD